MIGWLNSVQSTRVQLPDELIGLLGQNALLRELRFVNAGKIGQRDLFVALADRFGNGTADGDASMKTLLGGKG